MLKINASTLVFLSLSSVCYIALSQTPCEAASADRTPAQATNKTKKKAETPSLWRYSVGVGGSSLSYSESSYGNVSEKALTVKASVTRLFAGSRWDLGIGTYYTLLPFSASTDFAATPGTPPASGTTAASQSIRFLGVNARAGYNLPWLKNPWQLKVLLGAYYTTTMVSGNLYGFRNMTGPSISPTLARGFTGGKFALGYFKFSPVSSTSIIPSFSNKELAIGGVYGWSVGDRKSLGITLDLASLSLNISDVVISSKSASLGLAYGF